MSTTATQIDANQANAASSRNNLRHGFRSKSDSALLPGDDPAEYDALFADLTRVFAINGQTDLINQRFIREMVDAEWRLRRVRGYMQSALASRVLSISKDIEDPDAPDFTVDPEVLQRLALESLGKEHGTS